MLVLTVELGPIFGWGDNIDVMVFSPSRFKGTHAMVTEFTQHSAGIIEAGRADVANGLMNLKFTRLKKSGTALHCLPEQFQQCEHYTGFYKLDTPNLKQTVSPLSDVAHLATSFAKAKDRDVAWLKQLTSYSKPLDWGGYNAREDHKEAIPANPKTVFVFGPLWDIPPTHPGTMQTTMAFMYRAMQSFGMECTILTFDIQPTQLLDSVSSGCSADEL